MRSLPKPTAQTNTVFRNCIANFRDGDKKNRLVASAAAVAAAAANYDLHGTNGILHQIPTHTYVNGDVTAKEMMSVYTEKFVPEGMPGRELYIEIRNSATFNRCPLCCHHNASTIDHHLNKAGYPIFSVTPFNMVPACRDCNTMKDDHVPTTAEEVILHPYYDSVENDEWLLATVHQTVPAAVTYSVIHPAGWEEVLFRRTENHFRILQLGVLFVSHAAEELVNKRVAFTELHNAGGAAEVRTDLLRDANSFSAAYLNSWKAALYRALAASDWYCDGGFRI